MNRRTFLSLAVTIGVGVGAGLVVASCGDDTDDAASGSSSDAITIEGAWARTSPMMADAGAAYLTITSETDDALLSASVDAGVAAKVELHETKMVETEMDMSATTVAGMESEATPMTGNTTAPAMEMVPVDRVELPAGEAVALAPGGLHIMLLGLAAPLELEQTFTLTLTFADAGAVDVMVTVRDDAP
jgi:periplasmic copper chaperone A